MKSITHILMAFAVLTAGSLALAQPVLQIAQTQPAVVELLATDAQPAAFAVKDIVPDEEGIQRGTLTNVSDQPIEFAAYVGNEDPVLAIVQWERMGTDGWQAERLGFCGTGLTTFSLPPGESVDIALPHLGMDGTYRYTVTVTSPEFEDPIALYTHPVEIVGHVELPVE